MCIRDRSCAYVDCKPSLLGAGIYVSSGHVALPNDGIIVTGAGGRISEFRCISGSTRSNTGHLFDINEVDITLSNTDPFFTFRGSPGTVHVRSVRALASNEQGIYTCRIPNEMGTTVDVNVGLYLSGNTCKYYFPKRLKCSPDLQLHSS